MAHRNPPDSGTASLVESYPQLPATTPLDALAAIPEEQVWLASRKSPQTRRAYRCDVDHFMRTLDIQSADELRHINDKAVLAWEAYMREFEHVEASTVRRRLAIGLFNLRNGAKQENDLTRRDVLLDELRELAAGQPDTDGSGTRQDARGDALRHGSNRRPGRSSYAAARTS